MIEDYTKEELVQKIKDCKEQSLMDYTDTDEYPDDFKIITNGIKPGFGYEYVSSSYLNGLVNYVKPISAFVMRRYTVPKGFNDFNDDSEGNKLWKETCFYIDTFDDVHFKFGKCRDDVIYIGEIEEESTGNKCYVWFWFDWDVSDCAIGVVSKDKYEDDDHAIIAMMKDVIENVTLEYYWSGIGSVGRLLDEAGIDNIIKIIPRDKIRGWLSF